MAFNRDEVPDYYNIVTSPMDLYTIGERLQYDHYSAPKELVDDMKLVFRNCDQYNSATTVLHEVRGQIGDIYGDLHQGDP